MLFLFHRHHMSATPMHRVSDIPSSPLRRWFPTVLPRGFLPAEGIFGACENRPAQPIPRRAPSRKISVYAALMRQCRAFATFDFGAAGTSSTRRNRTKPLRCTINAHQNPTRVF
jgi:hypothetical protein